MSLISATGALPAKGVAFFFAVDTFANGDNLAATFAGAVVFHEAIGTAIIFSVKLGFEFRKFLATAATYAD